MANRIPFQIGEWYHCYSRGVDKRLTYLDEHDYQRFVQLLYLSNTESFLPRSVLKIKHKDIFSLEKGKPLVSIVAYAIMPNHFHLLLQEKNSGGIAKFMQKLGTSYGMFFNRKYDRIGNLFVKPFRSKHVGTDAYLRRVVDYIHLNPAELFDSDWKMGAAKNLAMIDKKITAYAYSSFPEYKKNKRRAEHTVLDEELSSMLSENQPSLTVMLKEYEEYYKELSKKDPSLGVT